METYTKAQVRHSAIYSFIVDRLKTLMEAGDFDTCVAVYPYFNKIVNTFVSPVDFGVDKTQNSLQELNVYCKVLKIDCFDSFNDYDVFMNKLTTCYVLDNSYGIIKINGSGEDHIRYFKIEDCR